MVIRCIGLYVVIRYRAVCGNTVYYTPVLEQTMNTEPVSGVQYSCESRPPLTRREHRHRYPVRSPVLEVEKTGNPRSDGFWIANFRLFSRILAVFLRK